MYLRNDVFISTEIFVGEHKLDNIKDIVNRGKVGFWLWIKIRIGACLPRVSHIVLNPLNHLQQRSRELSSSERMAQSTLDQLAASNPVCSGRHITCLK